MTVRKDRKDHGEKRRNTDRGGPDQGVRRKGVLRMAKANIKARKSLSHEGPDQGKKMLNVLHVAGLNIKARRSLSRALPEQGVIMRTVLPAGKAVSGKKRGNLSVPAVDIKEDPAGRNVVKNDPKGIPAPKRIRASMSRNGRGKRNPCG
jgi:hypothetical protein